MKINYLQHKQIYKKIHEYKDRCQDTDIVMNITVDEIAQKITTPRNCK